MRRTIFIIVLLLLVSTVNAITWQHQKRIAEEIGRSVDYEGSFRFVYYADRNDYLAYYRFNGDESHLITFYKSSLDLSELAFEWLVYHELGHYDEVKSVCKHSCNESLSEDYADNYADQQTIKDL